MPIEIHAVSPDIIFTLRYALFLYLFFYSFPVFSLLVYKIDTILIAKLLSNVIVLLFASNTYFSASSSASTSDSPDTGSASKAPARNCCVKLTGFSVLRWSTLMRNWVVSVLDAGSLVDVVQVVPVFSPNPAATLYVLVLWVGAPRVAPRVGERR